MKLEQKNQQGFTLLEVLVSLLITSTVIMIFFNVFSQSVMFSAKNEEEMVAVNIAREILYEVENYYTSNTATTGEYKCDNQTFQLAVPNIECPSTEGPTSFYPKVDITNSTVKDFYLVHVTIYRNETYTEKEITETFGYIDKGS